QIPVERLEDPRVTACCQVAENGVVQSELGLGDEMKEVVREPAVVADRPAPEIGTAVAVHFDCVPPVALLDERDLHWSALRTKNLYWRPSKVVSPLGVNPSFSRLRNAGALSG